MASARGVHIDAVGGSPGRRVGGAVSVRVSGQGELPKLRNVFSSPFLPPTVRSSRHVTGMWGLLSSLHALAAASVTPLHYDLVVVGGGSAGLTAAKFAARFKKSVLLVEKAQSLTLSLTLTLPNPCSKP